MWHGTTAIDLAWLFLSGHLVPLVVSGFAGGQGFWLG